MNQLIYLIFLFLYLIEIIKCIDIQLIFYPNGFNEDYIDYIIKEFNNYSVINDLNIKLVKNFYSSVTTAESYSETIEYLLNMKSSKYDMILFDMIDSKRLRKHLSNLKDYLLESTVEKFKDGLTNETYFINNNFVSMPLYLEYDMLYSNQNYLDKYDKSIPKTWNELIETAKYIISEEENDGNDVIGYTADISDTEEGFCSLYEYIYSFRNDISESYPEITSPEVEDGMETLKKLKNELGVYGMRSNNEDIAKCLNSTNCLFVKTWNNMPYIGNFTLTNIPGKVIGLSGSVIGGLHLGINKNISEEKKQKIAIIIEYIVMKELQYQTSMRFGFQSALKEVYENDSICQKYQQCQDFKSIQHILRPINAVENDKEYFKKYRNFLLKYLYNNDNLQECLQGIKYLTNIFNLDNSKFMVQYSMVVGITDLIMIICYFISYTKKQRHKFKQLSRFYWFIYLLGMIIIMSFGFTGIGEITPFKCRIRPLVLSLGFTMSNTVILTRMLTNFPESDLHFSRFCRNHYNRAIIISVLFDVSLYSLTLIKPTIVDTITYGDRLYSKCTVVSILNVIALGLIYLYKFAILLGMAVTIFTEWNVEECKYDVHYAIAILFISFIACISFCSLEGLHIFRFNLQFFIPAFVAYLYAVSCFFSYFIMRFFSKYSDENDDESIIKKARAIGKSDKVLNQFGSSDKTSGSMSSNKSSNSIPMKKPSFVEHLINLHNFGDEIKKSNDALRNSSISSSTNLSGTKVNIKKSSYGASLDSVRNFDDSITMARRASQITAIPENKIADSYAGSQSFNSTEQDSNNSDDHFTRTRTRSCDNFNPTFNRTQRVNSTPNKKYIGFAYGPYKRSVDSFTNPNSALNRKGSGLSFTNVQPINASSYSNVSSRKCSLANSINNSTSSLSNSDRHSNNNINTTGNGRSSDFIFNIQNIDLERDNSISNNVITTIEEENKNTLNGNGNGNEQECKIKNDTTMISVNPSVFTTTSFKSASDE